MRLLLLFVVLFFSTILMGHSQTGRVVGLRDNTPSVFAFTNATIVTEPGIVIKEGTLVIRDGMMESVGSRVSIPADAYRIDLDGKYIYPGFIDIYSHYGMPDDVKDELVSQAHWNPQVRSFYRASDVFRQNDKEAQAMRSQGFVATHTIPSHGIFAGQGAIVSLGLDEAAQLLIRNDVSQALSLSRSNALGRGYPHSSMGAFSLIRQTFYDAQWYVKAWQAYNNNQHATPRPETNTALDIVAGDVASGKPFIIEAADEQWTDRYGELSTEFPIKLWIVCSGYEYRISEGLADKNIPLILPLDFPETPKVASPVEAMNVSLETLRHWYYAPENAGRMIQKGHTVAITSKGLKNKNNFLKHLRMAVARGLTENDALAALTTTPASLLGLQSHYGSIAAGKTASFIIATDNIFTDKAEIDQLWIEGRRYQVRPERDDPRGTWAIATPKALSAMTVSIGGELSKLRGHVGSEAQQVKLSQVMMEKGHLVMIFEGDSLGLEGRYRLSAPFGTHELLGLGATSQGELYSWNARRKTQVAPEPEQPEGEQQGDKEPQQGGGHQHGTERLDSEQPEEEQTRNGRKPHKTLELPQRYPSIDFGLTGLPSQPDHVLIQNATIWTQGPLGKLEESDMLISRGRITEVGPSISVPRGALVVDATGMHVTPGLIDPHLHTSIQGSVNETADAITSETRILDVIDANNVWIYRLLAGGLTTAKLFHGSANPIGGQDAVIKMRWGSDANGLVMTEAKPGLKFALGENVKRSSDRYPSTRMGTEQIITDAFEAARQYEKDWQSWERHRRGVPPRRNLQLEPILEVLQGKRLSHVHAYRQDEMLMMMRLAETYGFIVTSFEHTLEGYKIADELRDHGAAAVVWTDWSSFKVEAADGILQNARLLNDAGVLTSLHSDNTQLATRMNWEAAKTVMTGMSEEDAMNLITLNPAKVMGIDHITGSLEKDKDADFVIWNGHPLSAFTTASQTWIEGRKYFDKQLDKHLQQDVLRERALIIEYILDQK